MSDTKFTKRQWEVFTKSSSENYALHIDCGGVMELTVITIAGDLSHADGAECTANAHLIAAAPEMYAMLELAISLIDGDSIEDFAYQYQEISTLLAKARGDS